MVFQVFPYPVSCPQRSGKHRSGRTALKNSGFQLPAKKITVNLSPAGVKKGGTAFDLPIAVAVLGAFGVLDTGGLGECLVIGELGLDGSVKPVPGVLVRYGGRKSRGIETVYPAGGK